MRSKDLVLTKEAGQKLLDDAVTKVNLIAKSLTQFEIPDVLDRETDEEAFAVKRYAVKNIETKEYLMDERKSNGAPLVAMGRLSKHCWPKTYASEANALVGRSLWLSNQGLPKDYPLKIVEIKLILPN